MTAGLELMLGPGSSSVGPPARCCAGKVDRGQTLLLRYFTAPSGPPSINGTQDGLESTAVCLPALLPLLKDHSGFLICCYSNHPLVLALREHTSCPVIGIFEASIAASLLVLGKDEQFGIISTGKVWEELLGEAVEGLLGSDSSKRFGRVETTGLNASELHEAEGGMVQLKMKEATRRLVRGGKVMAVCLGCAGMVGMREWVRDAAREELGEVQGNRIVIVDGVVMGLHSLRGLIALQ